jgi:hypothetical protein
MDAHLDDEEIMGLNIDQDLTAEQTAAIREQTKGLSRYVPEAIIAELMRKLGIPIPTKVTESTSHNGSAETSRQRRKRYGKQIQERLGQYIHKKYGINPQTHQNEWKEKVSKIQASLNRQQNVPNVEHLTADQWTERMRILDEWISKL